MSQPPPRFRTNRLTDRGQATVEFALLLPLIVMCVSLLVGTLVVCLQTLQLNDSARVIARAIATSDSPQLTANQLATPLLASAVVTTDSVTQVLTVHLTRSLHVPLVGIELPRIELHATSHILSEAPPVFR